MTAQTHQHDTLNDDIEILLNKVRKQTKSAERHASQADTLNPHLIEKTCSSLMRQLHQPCRIGFLGDANSGKTTLANQLIGKAVLPSSVVTNTRFVTRVAYGSQISATVNHRSIQFTEFDRFGEVDSAEKSVIRPGVSHCDIALPLPRLREIEVVDAPPNLTEVETDRLVAHADIWVWCTNAARAWSATDRQTRLRMSSIPPERAVLVATHADALGGYGARCAVRDRLDLDAGEMFAAVCFSSADAAVPGDAKADADAAAANVDAAAADVLAFARAIENVTSAYRQKRSRRIASLAKRVATGAMAAESAETSC
ncbi:MAG: dynamin family protein [Pseudomonadota bacterium]